MNINDFYLHAIRAKAHYKRDWVIRAFSLAMEDPEAWRKNPTPWRIVQSPTGYCYINEKLELEPITGSVVGETLYHPEFLLDVPKNFFEFWPEGGLTTPSNLLFNATALWPSVGSRFGYVNNEFDFKKIESKFAIMQDDPEEGQPDKPGALYVRDYLRFCNAVLYLEEFNTLFAASMTMRSLTPPPGLKEFKTHLLEKYKDKLNDPLTQTMIYKEIVAFAKEHLKGDASERFLISGKSLDVVYRKLFLIFGAEAGLDTSTLDMSLIVNSLAEGWQADRFVDMVNTSRAGSYDRGAETELGGTIAKWLERATANVRVIPNDCGTKTYKLVKVDKENVHRIVGKSLAETPPKMIETPEEANSYLGKIVRIRAPHFCRAEKTDYCAVCLGRNLSANPDAPSSAATGYGGSFLGMFLSAMHAKELKTAVIDLEACVT